MKINNIYVKVILWCIVVLFVWHGGIYADTIIFTDSSDYINIADKMEYFEDKNNSFFFEKVKKSTNWIKCKTKYINKSFSRSTYWFKFSLKNMTKVPLVLSTEYPKLDYITFFFPDSYGKYTNIKAGYKVHSYKNIMNPADFVFKIPVSEKKQTYFIKVKSKDFPVMFAPIIHNFNNFKIYKNKNDWIFLSYIFLMFFMIILSLFYYVVTKERAFLVQFIYILLWLIMQVDFYGYGYKLIWHNSNTFDKYLFVFIINIIGLTTIYIYRTYMDLKNNYPKIDKIVRYFGIYPIIFEIMLIPLLPYYIALKMSLLMALCTMFAEAVISAYFIYKKDILGILIFIGFLGMQVASFITILGVYDVYQNWFVARYFNLIGNVWVITFLILTMAYKYQLLRNRIKRAEEEKELLKFSVDKSYDMVFWVDSSAKFVYVNNAVVEILGYPKDELMSKKMYDFVYGADENHWRKLWEELEINKKLRNEFVFIKKDGTMVMLEVVANYIRFRGEIYNCIFARDITDRKKYEEEILKREKNLSITLQSIGDAVIVTDNKGVITRINPAAENITGYKSDEAVGHKFEEIVRLKNKDTGEYLDNIIIEIMNHEKVVELNNRIVLISKDNKEYYINDSGAPIKDEFGIVMGCIIVLRNITEEYLLQQQLNHTQKLEALGQLAGGISHDFNNIMGGIMSTAELMEMEEVKNENFDEYIHTIKKFSSRGASLSRKLLTFSRKDEIMWENINIVNIVNGVVELLRNTVNKKITIDHNSIPNKKIIIKGDAAQLETAILNIGLNAKDAMPAGGKMKFELNEVKLNEEFCNTHIINNTPGDYVEIIISDTGLGIDKDIINKIFEPFFTTKTVGKGTGLGLSMVYGTMIKHHGGISVYSEKGVGTTFKLYLKKEAGVKFKDAKKNKSEIYRGTGNILIIDDEKGISDILSKMLNKLGYTTVVYNDPEAAINYFRKKYSDIDLVLLDIIMPKKSGGEVFKILKSINSKVKVIMMSGYSGDLDIRQIKKEGVKEFIAKPFKISELSKIIKNIIDKK